MSHIDPIYHSRFLVSLHSAIILVPLWVRRLPYALEAGPLLATAACTSEVCGNIFLAPGTFNKALVRRIPVERPGCNSSLWTATSGGVHGGRHWSVLLRGKNTFGLWS